MKTKQFDKTEDSNTDAWNWIAETYKDLPLGKWECTFKKPTRSLKQNSALHLWFELLSEEMQKAGVPLYIRIADKESERDWDAEVVKRDLYHPVMKAMTGKTSTAKLTTKEIDKVCKPIVMWLAKEWKILVPFPNELERQILNTPN